MQHFRYLESNLDLLIILKFIKLYRYVDDVLPLNNSRFGDYLHLIYPNELEVKDTTDPQKCVSYLEIDNAGRLIIKLYGKRDDSDAREYTQFLLLKTHPPCYLCVIVKSCISYCQ
jgi:hypothetical protein